LGVPGADRFDYAGFVTAAKTGPDAGVVTMGDLFATPAAAAGGEDEVLDLFGLGASPGGTDTTDTTNTAPAVPMAPAAPTVGAIAAPTPPDRFPNMTPATPPVTPKTATTLCWDD